MAQKVTSRELFRHLAGMPSMPSNVTKLAIKLGPAGQPVRIELERFVEPAEADAIGKVLVEDYALVRLEKKNEALETDDPP